MAAGHSPPGPNEAAHCTHSQWDALEEWELLCGATAQHGQSIKDQPGQNQMAFKSRFMSDKNKISKISGDIL